MGVGIFCRGYGGFVEVRGLWWVYGEVVERGIGSYIRERFCGMI